MKSYIIILTLIITTSCACPPASQITNGKAAQKHDLKKFRATYHQVGSVYVIRYENKQELRKEITNCKPNFTNGSWVMKANQTCLDPKEFFRLKETQTRAKKQF